MILSVCACKALHIYTGNTVVATCTHPLPPSFFVTCAAVQSRWTLVRVGKRVNWCVELYRTIFYVYTYMCISVLQNKQFSMSGNPLPVWGPLINDWWSDLWICASSAMEGEIVRKLYKYIENITAVSCFIYVDITIHIQLPIYYKLFSKWVYSKWVYKNKKISHTAFTDRNDVILTACAGHVCFQICVKFC